MIEHKVFDADFSWLERLPYRERIPGVLAILEKYKTSPMVLAITLHFTDIDDLAREEYPELTSLSERRNRFLTVFMPKKTSWDRRRISEYRIAGDMAVKYAAKLQEAGADIFQDEILTKLLLLPKAIEKYADESQVLRNLVSMSCRAFERYAQGDSESVSTVTFPFKEYIDACEQQESLLSL